MPRGTTLANLLVMLKAEIGDNATGNSTRDTQLKQLLSNKQQLLASTYMWPFLERKWDVALPANTRYVSFPTTTATGSDFAEADVVLNQEHSVVVDVKSGASWLPVDYGIGPDELSFLDSDTAGIHSTILRWRWASNVTDTTPANENKIEVWPVPSQENILRITGQRKLKPLVANDDVADLDDILLVSFVAADRLLFAGQESPAQLMMRLAQERLASVRTAYPERQELLIMGQAMDNKNNWDERRSRRVIAIA